MSTLTHISLHLFWNVIVVVGLFFSLPFVLALFQSGLFLFEHISPFRKTVCAVFIIITIAIAMIIVVDVAIFCLPALGSCANECSMWRNVYLTFSMSIIIIWYLNEYDVVFVRKFCPVSENDE